MIRLGEFCVCVKWVLIMKTLVPAMLFEGKAKTFLIFLEMKHSKLSFSLLAFPVCHGKISTVLRSIHAIFTVFFSYQFCKLSGWLLRHFEGC